MIHKLAFHSHLQATPWPQGSSIIWMEVVELKVRLHCKACERSVRRTLYKLEGVTCVEIDLISSKITVLGYIDQNTIIKAVRKTGRRASDWANHCHGSGNGCSGCRTRTRVPVSAATQSHSKETRVPTMEKRFSKRKSYLSHKVLQAICVKGKQSDLD